MIYFKDIYRPFATKKSFQAKNLPNTDKTVCYVLASVTQLKI